MSGGPESYDAMVVGSGYGGAVAACRMSMAGMKVCLVEKGRRWEAHDFPTDAFGLPSAVRIEWNKWGLALGSDKALFQIHENGDSLAAVACGFGGGSLINAGVLLPTPVRARRDPKWPKDWNKDWDHLERVASSMLGAQNVPFEFANGQVIKQVLKEEIEDYKPDPIKLSINFDRNGDEESRNFVGSTKLENCLGCGNCFSGCPYNAKNSTDKNYLALAKEAGCVVRTESKVQYIVKEQNKVCLHNGMNLHRRRWRVYFNDLEYTNTDIVVLSAGVLGTTEILFKSQRRGLGLSERLGFGLSCNGNNVAFVTRSKAPLHAYGMNKKQFSEAAFHNRPGPAISASFTSSKGFTIQPGVLPTTCPSLLIKGITTYGWATCYWLLHGLMDKLKCSILGLKAGQDIILNAMGYDACDGRITFDGETEKIRITPPNDPVGLKKFLAFQNLTRKLGGILIMPSYRSTSVHLLGGCNAATNPTFGVCDSYGRVFNPNSNHIESHEGLYVCDASLIPCSTGINPSLTITTLSELISQQIVDDALRFKSTTIQEKEDIKMKHANENMHAILKDREKPENMWGDKVLVKETMKGFIEGMPCTAYLTMHMNCSSKEVFGHESLATRYPDSLLNGKVGGYVVFKNTSLMKLFILDGKVDLCEVDSRTPYTQHMHYYLTLASATGSRYILEGKKVMNPFLLALNAWHESTTMYVTFREVEKTDNKDQKQHNKSSEELPCLRGTLSISIFDLLMSVIRLKGKQKGKFIFFFLQSLWRTYILQVPRYIKDGLDTPEENQSHYPPYILHYLKTEDGATISCKQWRSKPNLWKPQEGRPRYPVLLLNGYSGESYWLPTERRDLVRILLEEGYDTWLLQSRLHPLHPSNNFTIEDIGEFDIPAAIAKIHEVHGSFSRIHVIAHCVGGLAIHIALMGGHISARSIASLSCTNSSMYFKLTNYARLKMRLPLVPVAMAVIGKNKIVSMTDGSKDEFRHSLLKSAVKIIPRTERCTANECQIFSGIFGNVFWHGNISKMLHQWLSKQNVTHLPMSGFPHLRKICNAGYIVNRKGKNEYLIHSERMAVPTLYISGGRSLLVTAETSMLAFKYMKLHQPGFRHKRVVVEGFGHSDLMIGEDSYKCVFPHFISHIRMAEDGGRRKEDNAVSREAFYDDNDVSSGPAFFFCLIALLFLFYLLTLK